MIVASIAFHELGPDPSGLTNNRLFTYILTKAVFNPQFVLQFENDHAI